MQNSQEPISILTYHSIDLSGSVVSCAPRDFADHMQRLSDEGFRGVSLREAVAHRQLHASWPEKSAVLTFDDGFANFNEEALPVLMKHNFTGTVFVISGHMSGLNDWAKPPKGLGAKKILSWRQVSEIAASGIEIGSHTRTHPDLRRCGLEMARLEMSDSRKEIEDHLGCTVGSFAYPYGGTSNRLRLLAANEFNAACTTQLRRANSDPLNSLPRVDMYYVRSPHNLQRLLSGHLDRYLAVRSAGRAIRGALPTDFVRIGNAALTV
jgi:peptidoglycan/xylan/chitin deacetylase (PgdA/CDA1 family)